jgi:hypothetical protein
MDAIVVCHFIGLVEVIVGGFLILSNPQDDAVDHNKTNGVY